jgi:hypothetical protein
MERRERGFIGWTRCSNYCQETGRIKRSNGGSFGFQGERGPLERMKPTGGSYLSLVEERKGVPFRDFSRAGCGLLAVLGRIRCPWPFCTFFSSLFFFLFCFLISLITFVNLVQIASNQLCKVSRIQNNIPEQ